MFDIIQSMLIKYHDLPKEIRKTGLTQKEVSEILGITPQALNARIRKGRPDIHLIMYALSHYYGNESIDMSRDLWFIPIFVITAYKDIQEQTQ